MFKPPHLLSALGTKLPGVGLCVLAGAFVGCRHQLETSQTALVPAETFLMGSSLDERALALELAYAGAGGPFSDAHAWLANELPQSEQRTEAYWIMTRPVTQAEYRNYVRIMGRPEPYVDSETWKRQGSAIPYEQVERRLWVRGTPSKDRADHPVVLVNREDADGYCRWWGEERHGNGFLPTEAQWEHAARGKDGRWFPWGDAYDPRRLNSADSQIGDTVGVGLYITGASPHGLLGMAGNVFEWTQTSSGDGGYIVKGGSYLTHGESSRAAARHARPGAVRHVAIGFRCALVERSDRRHGPQSGDDAVGAVHVPQAERQALSTTPERGHTSSQTPNHTPNHIPSEQASGSGRATKH